MRKLKIDFYQRSDVVKIAKELLGKILNRYLKILANSADK